MTTLRRVNVSVDVDTLRYYANFAPSGTCIKDRVMSYTMPRMLDLFDELDVRVTLFAIGDTIEEAQPFWRRAAQAGHEVASHSQSHVQAFFQLSRVKKMEELQRGKATIEDCVGTEVVGFRAPAYNFDAETLELLLDCGYRYDSSFHPGWYVPAGKLVTRVLSRTYRPIPTSPIYWRHWRLQDRPFHWSLKSGNLLEIPLTVTRFAKPFVGTVHLSTSRNFFASEVAWLARRKNFIQYELHPTEVLDNELLEESPWARNIPGVGKHPDPWDFLRYRLQTLKTIGNISLLRDWSASEATTVYPRA